MQMDPNWKQRTMSTTRNQPQEGNSQLDKMESHTNRLIQDSLTQSKHPSFSDLEDWICLLNLE